MSRDDLTQLWSIVLDLTEQLSANQKLVAEIKERSANVKGQAVHAGAGFPLRRFNLDISDEEFQSELERFASHLVLEIQQLQHENKQLNVLLKEYESTLEQVMGKFRGVAHASQQHDLSLHSYYSSLLQTLQTAHSSARLHDNTSLSLLLTRLSTLLRSALRSLGGEDAEVEAEGILTSLAEIANGGTEGSSGPPSPTKSASSGKRSIQRAPARLNPFPGSVPGSTGGYFGTDGKGDWALEREMEIIRLEEENRQLRELLAIAEESPAAQEVGNELKEEESQPTSPPPGSRKNSLTVEELEAGAEEEAAWRQRAIDSGLVDNHGNPLEAGLPGSEAETTPLPGTGLGGGGGLSVGMQRPVFNEAGLAFSDEISPEDAIEDVEDDSEP